MRKIFPLYAAAALALVSLAGCKDDYEEYDNSYILDNAETMTLTPSSEYVALDELNSGNPDDIALSFTWTPARQMPDDYIVTYRVELDLEANEFSAPEYEYFYEDQEFRKTYTTDELQALITETWGQSDKSDVVLAFRVIAMWDGGTKYVMPEVRTVSVTVRPYRPLTFEADNIYLSGSALTGTTQQIVGKTLEDEYKYAIVQTLKPGVLNIPIELEGVTTYIAPAISGEFQDGIAVPAVISETEPEDADAWQIPGEGNYRVIINILDKTVTIYSPENPFNDNYIAEWYANGRPDNFPIPTTTEIVGPLWLRGEANNWGSGQQLNFTQSLADPMVLVYSGTSLGTGRNHFTIVQSATWDATGSGTPQTYGFNNVAVIAPPRIDKDNDGLMDFLSPEEGGTGKGGYDQDVTLGTWMDMSVGADMREVFWKLPSGVSKVVVDLRNMKIKMDKQ